MPECQKIKKGGLDQYGPELKQYAAFAALLACKVHMLKVTMERVKGLHSQTKV